ncbi:sigma-54-dependent Fis family transcriptional regulator [bacterium]|nr:sigma-54-dependent Fis family transcriptional regulator [bacterium]
MGAEHPLQIIMVDDEINMLESMGDVLRDVGYQVSTASSGQEALERLERENGEYDLLITDLKMPGMNGMELLNAVHDLYPAIKVIVLTGFGSVDGAVEAMRRGAWDYILKPFNPEEALSSIKRIESEKEVFLDKNFFLPELSRKFGFDSIIGNSPAIQDIFRNVATAAKSNSSILLTGESGTGKELLAHVIHYFSFRSAQPFIKTSCASFSEGVLESELFGHEKGAFTSAVTQRKGRFELANKGTLFLDEIGDIPLHTQIKLVRVLQTQEFERVGGAESIKVDVRLISATHQNLAQLIRDKTFREDLFYRLNVIPIEVPPLRDRREDIPLLVDFFLNQFATETKKRIDSVGKSAMNALVNYDWPGNIRELRNVLERAVVLTEGRKISLSDLSREIVHKRNRNELTLQLKSRTLQEAERALIEHCLNETSWNLSKTAKILEISRGTLYSKMMKLGFRDGEKKDEE